MRGLAVMSALAALAACTPQEEGARDVRSYSVEMIAENRFGVTIEAMNIDGYELARCVAAAYTSAQVDMDGRRIFPYFVRDGGKIVDEFRRVDGVRMQTARGVQTYSFANAAQFTDADHDGRDVMAVDIQLAKCEKQGLPTTYGGS